MELTKNGELRWIDKMEIRESMSKLKKSEINRRCGLCYSDSDLRRIHKDVIVKEGSNFVIKRWEINLKNKQEKR